MNIADPTTAELAGIYLSIFAFVVQAVMVMVAIRRSNRQHAPFANSAVVRTWARRRFAIVQRRQAQALA